MNLSITNPIYYIIKNYLLEGHTEERMLLILFYSFDISIDKKFAFLKTTLENPFLKDSPIIPHFWGLFQKIQKIIWGVRRVLFLWKYKRAKTYNTEDLFMNPICEGQKGTICILENDTKYLFHIRELINSIQTNLSNCSHFFPDVKPCKNPYTNLPFKKSNLYNIYFKCRSSAYHIPPLLEAFFLESFNIQRFSRKNMFLINEEYLNQYSKTNVNIYNIKDCVDEMFSLFKLRLEIHKNFSKYRLIEIMLPYIDLYNKSQYYMNTNKSERLYRSLYHKLHRFIEYNRCFGRQKIHIHKKYDPILNTFVQEKIVSYDDDHPLFEENNNIPFMTNHIECILNNRIRGSQPSNIEIPLIVFNQVEEEEYEDEEEYETNTPILYDSTLSEDSNETE